MEGGRHALAELAFRFPKVDTADLRVLHTRLTPATLKSTLVQQHMELPRQGFSKLIDARDYQAAYGDDWVETTRTVFGKAADRVLHGDPRANGPLMTTSGAPAPPGIETTLQALQSTRTAMLKARFLAAGEGDTAVRAGEHVIRRLVNTKRRTFPHTAAYEISVLEATLLLEFAVLNHVWSLVEEEGEKLRRYVHGYR
jgi:hypothetical protein